MFSFINRTVFDIPLTWDRTRFQATRLKYRLARKLVEISINVQFQKQLRNLHRANLDIEQSITKTNEELSKHEKKVYIFDNLSEIASQSSSTYFDKRMENIRIIIQKHCNDIQRILQDEHQYWNDIHSAIDQDLITSNDIHPCKSLVENYSKNENLITTKEERVSVVLPSINKTYVIKLEETTDRLSSLETSPIYSPPNPPAQLYFSPTFIQDQQSDSIRNVLSPIDQNQTNLIKPRVIIHRIAQSFLIDYLKTKESKSISRKRKQSVLEDNDTKSNTIALRKRKSVSVIEIEDKKPRKRRNKKPNKKQIPIREPSPLPIIDRSKHYSTCFSTRSHRLDNFENADNTNQSKSSSRLRKRKR